MLSSQLWIYIHLFVLKSWSCVVKISPSVSLFNLSALILVICFDCYLFLCTSHVHICTVFAMFLFYCSFDLSYRLVWSLQYSISFHAIPASVYLLHCHSNIISIFLFHFQMSSVLTTFHVHLFSMISSVLQNGCLDEMDILSLFFYGLLNFRSSKGKEATSQPHLHRDNQDQLLK